MFHYNEALATFTIISIYSRNPTPGIILNDPAGQDVYHGVPKDYTGSVNADKFGGEERRHMLYTLKSNI